MAVIIATSETLGSDKLIKVYIGSRLMTFEYDEGTAYHAQLKTCVESFLSELNEEKSSNFAIGDSHKLPDSFDTQGLAFILINRK